MTAPMNTTLAAWALSLMLAKAPPDRAQFFPGWSETVEERTYRYAEIAADAAYVGGDKARVAKILGVSFHESAWTKDVDLGPCYREGKHEPRCDHGRAACMMQVRVDVHSQYTAEQLFGSRRACFAAGLAIIQHSERACRHLGWGYTFDVYAQGRCSAEDAPTKTGLELAVLARDFHRWRPMASQRPQAGILDAFGPGPGR